MPYDSYDDGPSEREVAELRDALAAEKAAREKAEAELAATEIALDKTAPRADAAERDLGEARERDGNECAEWVGNWTFVPSDGQCNVGYRRLSVRKAIRAYFMEPREPDVRDSIERMRREHMHRAAQANAGEGE